MFFKNTKASIPIIISFLAILIFFILSALVSYLNTNTIKKNQELITQTHQVILDLEKLLSLTKDAETGQRGYVITGNDKYLEPYDNAVATVGQQLLQIKAQILDNPTQLNNLTELQLHLKAKMSELNETVQLRKDKGFDAAYQVVITDRGKSDMDIIRQVIESMTKEEDRIRARRIEEVNDAYRIAIVSNLFCAIFGMVLTIAIAILLLRGLAAQQRRNWLQSGQVGLSDNITGEFSPAKLGENILKFLAEYLNAQAGAFYILEKDAFRRISTYGLPEGNSAPLLLNPGEGLLGQAIINHNSVIIRNVPNGYLQIGSALGKSNPKNLLIATAIVDGLVNAVFELGFFGEVDDNTIELLNSVSEPMAIAVRSANYRVHLQNLLEETQTQSEELQSQSEELRVNNEELEEQSRALKSSQVNLEQQQIELEQANTQLEEQTQILEQERDSLNQITKTLQDKTFDLEQASRYKSDFLANMSHELRTPLNSSLILAKLLADNPRGNLDAEQVKYAQNIQSSGNDLLNLINDILDLSKIEAGHMEIVSETVSVAWILQDMERMFEPLAKERNFNFLVQKSADCADSVQTDRMRLEQVIKNLLSNAFKFTEKGQVKLIAAQNKDSLAFTVSDTGIGISEDNYHTIFEAFRQADSTISRKYGGTGLGLSICKELTHLLGGEITVTSTPGKGSDFTVSIPLVYKGAKTKKHAHKSVMPSVQEENKHVEAHPAVAFKTHSVSDDRDKLNNSSRTILIVEDDEIFARILRDIAHEIGFQCIITATAEEAILTARQYRLNAVLLDMVLPDHLGLTVIDRLKRDVRTRHLPIHVVSAGDYMETALSMGAIGYMIKPVKRDELMDALKRLEGKLEQQMRHILIVEDDALQRESLTKLLESQNVKIDAVGTVAECLEKLKVTTYDCMVLDLTLPDASGYSLLETLSNEDRYSFPPVIVYTGRVLSSAEEQKLRRYSRSIIIKGARSPERLMDEVTLFLHQVVSDLPPEQQQLLEKSRSRDDAFIDRHIMLAEDDVRNVYAISSILEPHGAKVHIARNGREALEMLEARKKADQPIDLVLMDVMMPEMDGITAIHEIRKRSDFKKLPIIVLTAKAMREDQERCIQAGANDYMAKPIDVEKLLSLVRVWLPR